MIFEKNERLYVICKKIWFLYISGLSMSNIELISKEMHRECVWIFFHDILIKLFMVYYGYIQVRCRN